MSDEIIYCTGISLDGEMLIGGVWTLRDQEGFPLEMAHLVCRDKGWRIDWLEAMADASRQDKCPALMEQIEAFLPSDTVFMLKLGFVSAYRSGKTWEEIVADKRANGRKVDEWAKSFVESTA